MKRSNIRRQDSGRIQIFTVGAFVVLAASEKDFTQTILLTDKVCLRLDGITKELTMTNDAVAYVFY